LVFVAWLKPSTETPLENNKFIWHELWVQFFRLPQTKLKRNSPTSPELGVETWICMTRRCQLPTLYNAIDRNPVPGGPRKTQLYCTSHVDYDDDGSGTIPTRNFYNVIWHRFRQFPSSLSAFGFGKTVGDNDEWRSGRSIVDERSPLFLIFSKWIIRW
jgi:hypothetical protein